MTSKSDKILTSKNLLMIAFLSVLPFCSTLPKALSSEENTLREALANSFLTYENSNLGIKMQFPYFWVNLDFEGSIEGFRDVIFVPLLGNSTEFSAYVNVGNVSLLSPLLSDQNTTLKEFTTSKLESLEKSLPNFRVIELNSTEFGGQPAQKLLYSYSSPFGEGERRGIQVWTVYQDRLYSFKYIADITEYSDNLQKIQTMIDSFQII